MQGIPFDLVKVLAWSVAILLFIIGAYSDESTTELFGWGYALLAAGFVAGELPKYMGRAKP